MLSGRIMRTSGFLGGLILSVGLAMASSVRASTITQIQTAMPANVPFSTILNFNRFNPALGTLTGVEIGGFASSNAEVDIFNTTGAAIPFTNANATTPINVTSPDGLTTSVNATAGPFNGVANPGLNAFPGSVQNTAFTNVFVSAANLNQYILSGPPVPVSLTFTSGASMYSGTASPGVFFGGNTNSGGSVSLTYFYTALSSVPLPSVAPAGLALIGILGAMKWARRSKNKAAA